MLQVMGYGSNEFNVQSSISYRYTEGLPPPVDSPVTQLIKPRGGSAVGRCRWNQVDP